jgi:hypothetical protein
MMRAEFPPETVVEFQQTRRHFIPEDSIRHKIDLKTSNPTITILALPLIS